MNRARLKEKLFKSYGAAVIMSMDDRYTTWAGLQSNPWLPVTFHKRYTTVKINDRDFKIDPSEWEIEGGFGKMYTVKSRYREHPKVVKGEE